jgi:hypothetical protein
MMLELVGFGRGLLLNIIRPTREDADSHTKDGEKYSKPGVCQGDLG